MNVHKTSEKVLLWMRREKLTQQQLSESLGITRQTFIARMRDNSFKTRELVILNELGYSD